MAGKAKSASGTKHTEEVIGSALGQMKKGISELGNVVETVNKLVEEAEQLSGIIAAKEIKIEELDVAFGEAKRQKEIQLKMDLQENALRAAADILSSQGKIAIDKSAYESITKELSETKTNMDKEISKQVNSAASSMKKDFDNAAALAASDYKAKEAQTTAQLSTLQGQITFLSGQVEMWKGALDAERAAGVQRAQAASIGSVNITGGK